MTAKQKIHHTCCIILEVTSKVFNTSANDNVTLTDLCFICVRAQQRQAKLYRLPEQP